MSSRSRKLQSRPHRHYGLWASKTAMPTAPAPQTAGEAEPHSRWAAAWKFVNSPVTVWLFSSVLLSGTVFEFNKFQDGRHERQAIAEKIEKLDLEIAGRITQFGEWANKNLFRQADGDGVLFQDNISNQRIEAAITGLADKPRRSGHADRPYIQEVFPEFKKRNLISLYAELSMINDKAANAAAAGAGEAAPETRRAQYRFAMNSLLNPAMLLRYQPEPNHDIFVDAFQSIFLTREIRDTGLPYTDCLENHGAAGCPIAGQANASEHDRQPQMLAVNQVAVRH